MNRDLPSCAMGLLRGETRVIVPSLVKELARTIWKGVALILDIASSRSDGLPQGAKC